MDFYVTAVILGLCLAVMSLGIFISMKIFKIPDITTDGSYTLGGVVTAVSLTSSLHFALALPIVIVSGALAGVATGLVHTRFKIDALLSGILVMTGLYSLNLSILGRSNIPLIGTSNLFHIWADPSTFDKLLIAIGFIGVLWLIKGYVLKTDFGIAMRATGDSPNMSRSLGININRMKITGLALSNALTALSGYLVCQYQGFADINMGIGIVIVGLGSVLIADSLIHFFKVRGILAQLFFVIIGSVLFQLVLAFALSIGINPNLLKLITALFVLLIVGLPALLKKND